MKMDQDFEDDFQFKPLTEGLGFHPKKQEVTIAKSPISQPLISAQAATIAPTPRKVSPLETPLPRPKNPAPQPRPSASTETVDGLLKSLQDKNKSLKFEDKSKTQSPYLNTAPSLAAGLLDWLLIVSISLFYMMTMTLTLKMDLIRLITEGSLGVLATTGGLFLTVGFVYYLSQRIFMGSTLGEWAYEQRLGLPEEFKSGYSIRAFSRLILIFVTGIILLPLLSWALNRDLAGVSGLSTYRRR